MYFSQNIKLLRSRRKRSQADLAETLEIKRSSLSGYELGSAFPNFETLIRISNFFKISIDKLLRVDLDSISELQLSELEKGYDIDLNGGGLRVLATTVDANNEENIELVDVQDFQSVTGKGVIGTIDGKQVGLGNRKLHH